MPLHPRTFLLRAAAAGVRPVVTVGLISTLATCGTARASDDPLTALADALEVTGVAPRLSVSTAFQPCTQAAPQGGTIVQARCAAAGPDQKARLSRLAAGFANRRDDPAAMHALAIVDLVADDSSGRALDRSITNLRQAAALADEPAAPLADLAAALIVRAEHTQVPRDLLEAYEIAAQAVRQDSGNLAALYNRALALDRFGLVDETAADWRAYLTADSTSGWADDARRRLHAALAIGPPAPPPADAPLSAYAAYAAADPQGARELGMDRLLAEWGEAVEAGDTARAAHRLRRAAALGDALEHRPGGDASLADMVRAIHAAVPNATALRTLARAHREYGAGIRLFDALDYAAAQPRFAAAAGLGASPVLQRWARVHLGIVRVMQGGAEEGQRLLAAQAAAGDTGRNAALVARARWALGRTLSQRERWEAGLRNAEASARLFARTGERENEGAVLSLASEKHFLLGEPDSGYAAMHAGLQRLRPYRASVRLHGVLAASADAMAADGLNRSAVRTMAEGVGVGIRTGDPFFAAEARLKRARHLATAGDPSGARTDVDAARGLVPRIHQPGARGWMAANLAEVQALLSLHADAVGATRRLDSAAAYYAGAQFTYRVLPVLVAAAEARLLAGDAAGALRRLEDAVRMLDRRREEIGLEPRRAAVFDAARAVVDRVVLLELAAGRTDAALRHMDRARASLAGTGRPLDGDVAVAAPPGETAIEYARIADTLLTWTVSSGGVHVSRTVLDTVRLARTIQEVETRLQRGATEVEVRPGLSLLYDWLVRPVEARLDTGTPLVVVADGEIAAVPFAALHDARRGRYLVEDRPIRFAVSLAEARRTQPGDRADGVLLVADPAHDAREHPLLERLAHARAEVDSIVPSYPGASLLEGPRASPSALRSALARAGVFHFAGHAVFDDQRPERSYLVLAPAAHPSGAGRITAAELARLDLSRMRLVVLSACRTVRSGTSRAGGFTGLSGALLAAGAGGAIGSTWEVDDRWTAALMTRFHRAYRQSHDGPRSLRAAQLALLHSEDPALRTPAAWAGFRYAGK